MGPDPNTLLTSETEVRQPAYSKNVVRLGVVSFFTDVSTEMIHGVLPFFITVELGASRAVLGLIEGIGESVSYSTRAASGALSDRIGRRKLLVLAGYGLSTISKVFFAVSSSVAHVLAARTSDRVGKGVRTSPRDALLSDSVSKERTGRSFGLQRSMDQAGAIIGPLLAFLIIPYLGIRGVFWLSFVPAAVAVIVLGLFVIEKRVAPRTTSVLSNFREVIRGRFLLLLIVFTIFSLGAFNFSFVLLKGIELGVSASLVPVIYATINVTHTAVRYPSGALSDKLGGERVVLLSYSLFTITSLMGLLASGGLQLVFVMAAVFGLYLGISETVQRAIVPKYVTTDLRGTAYGAYYLFVGLSFLVANIVFGALWEDFGSQYAFVYSIVMSLGAAVVLAVLLATARLRP